MRYVYDSAYSRMFPENDKKRRKANSYVNRLSEKTINWLYDIMCVNKNLNATLEDKKDFVYYAKCENLRYNLKHCFKKDLTFEKIKKSYSKIPDAEFVNQNGAKFTVIEK